MRKGIVKSTLEGFLGTYSSRYSHWQGYWLWGFVVSNHLHYEWDLLSRFDNPFYGPLGKAKQLAFERFDEQCRKARVVGWFSEAVLTIDAGVPSVQCGLDGRDRLGYELSLAVRVHTTWGFAMERRRIIVVAPHDPSFESASISFI